MRTLLAFLWKHQFFTLFLLLEALSFLMLVNSYSYQRTLSFNAANDVTGGVFKAVANMSDYLFLREQNKQLLLENAQLRNSLKSSFLHTDTAGAYGDSLYRYIPAQIIRNTTHTYNNFMVLNIGRLQGIEKEMGVISGQGIAGVVIGVSAHYSLAMSLLNNNAKISARIKKNQQLVNVVWNEDHPKLGKIVDIPSHIILNRGDTIVTSGNSFIFPAGIPVGTVLSYKPNENRGLNSAKLQYSTDFNNLHQVYIIRNLMKEEEQQLLKQGTHE